VSHNSSLVPEPIGIYEPAVPLRTCHRWGCSGASSFRLAFCHFCPLLIAEYSGINSHQQWVNYHVILWKMFENNQESCADITNWQYCL